MTFQGVEIDGLSGVSPSEVEPLLAMVAESGSTIGVGAVRDVPPEIDLTAYRPLAGRRVTASDGPFAIALRLRMPDQDVSIRSLRVTFQVGDGPVQVQTIPAAARLCPDHGDKPQCQAPDVPPVSAARGGSIRP